MAASSPALDAWIAGPLGRMLIEQERARLNADDFAEQYEAVFLGSEFEPCDACGYPSATASGWAVMEQGDVLPTCAACGHEIDKDGTTLWVVYRPGGDPSLTRVVLCPRPEVSGLPGSGVGTASL